MADFNKYTNYKDRYGVSGVVFGANATVLEVELNEMQEIQSNMLRDAINAIVGVDSSTVFVTDLDDISIDGNGVVKIAKGTTFIYGEHVMTLPQEYQIDTKTLGLQEGHLKPLILNIQIGISNNYDSNLNEGGYNDANNSIANWFEDNRGFGQTTKRKLVKFEISTEMSMGDIIGGSDPTGFSKENHNIIIAQLGNGFINKTIKEVNIRKLIDRLDAMDVNDMRGVYGVEVDYRNGTVTRIAESVGKTGGSDFNSIGAFNRRRCLITETDGNVLAYYGDSNYYDDKTGVTTKVMTATNGTSVPAGSRINTVVEQRKFYYRVVPVEIDRIYNDDEDSGYHIVKARYYISDTYKPGFKVHPAFIKKLSTGSTLEFDRIYIGAYKSVAYDANGLANDSIYEDNAEDLDYSAGGLASVSGIVPVSGLYYNMTMNNIRRLLTNMDEDGFWRMKDITVMSMDILLFLVEYATLDAQSVLGRGWVDHTTGDNRFNLSQPNGLTASLGNNSSTPESYNTNKAISYRGEENIFGGLFEYIEGFMAGVNSASNGQSTWSNTLRPFGAYPEYDNVHFHQDVGISGFINAFGYNYDHDWMFIPTRADGNSVLPVGDMISPHNAYDGYGYILVYGGNWYSQDGAGICNIGLASDAKSVNYGSRIVYFPYKLGKNID